jgi:hypothetical protein
MQAPSLLPRISVSAVVVKPHFDFVTVFTTFGPVTNM